RRVTSTRENQTDERTGEEDRILESMPTARHHDPVEEDAPLPMLDPNADGDVEERRGRGPAREPSDPDQQSADELCKSGKKGEHVRRLQMPLRITRRGV